MKIAAQRLNNGGIVIVRDSLEKALAKYNTMYSKACYRLYDLGYQESPSEFVLRVFSKAMWQSFPQDMTLLQSNLDGSVTLTLTVINYALAKSHNKDFKEALGCFKDITVAESGIEALTNLKSKVNLKKNDRAVFKPRLSVSDKVLDSGKVSLDDPAVWESFERHDNTKLRYVDTRDQIIKHLCKDIGVSDKDYEANLKTGHAFFIKGMSAKDELNYVSAICSGVIYCDGKFGKQLNTRIEQYYKEHFSKASSRLSCIKYESKIFIDSLSDRLDATMKARQEVEALGGREFYVTEDYVVFEVPNTVEESKKESYFKNGFRVGNYVFDYIGRCELPKCNNLLGISGEYISKKNVEEKGYDAEGLPVKLHKLMRVGKEIKDITEDYYPISRVYYSAERNAVGERKYGTLLPLIGSDFEVTFSEIAVALDKIGVPSKDGLFKSIRSRVDTALNITCSMRDYATLVAELVCALVHMECGYPDYELCESDYTFVTDDIYMKACYDAELLYGTLGL